MYADYIYARLYMGCGYPIVDIHLCELYLYGFSFTRIIA